MTKLGAYGALAAISVLLLGVVVVAEEKRTETFISKAIDCTNCEKELAQKVAKTTTNEDVKNFALRLAADHAKLEKDLMDLAKQRNIAVATGTNKEAREKVAELMKLKGQDFDRRYVDLMIEEHEKDLKMLEDWEKNTKDDACRACVERAIPVVRKHLADARTLQKELNRNR
jgi:putative membrane protein